MTTAERADVSRYGNHSHDSYFLDNPPGNDRPEPTNEVDDRYVGGALGCICPIVVNEAAMFETILNLQGAALEELMTNQPTSNPKKMEQAKQLLDEAICLAIQASKELVAGE